MTAPQPLTGPSQAYHEGSQVWVPHVEVVNSIADGSKKRTTSWRRGAVQSVSPRDDGPAQLTVRTEDGTVVTIAASECCLQNERDDTVDDLVRSDFLHEPGILHTLKVRYGMDAIYTYSGQILIATNPHKRVRHLYGPRMMGQYKGVPLGELSPHVYAIAEAAYAAMMMDEQRQAILISGESGAGKTESAKMVMQYLAHRAGGPPSGGSGGGAAGGHAMNGVTSADGVSAPIEEQVLESNPLLEAFGNAKTARNDNSSRFGKFVEIDFDAAGRVTGASISTYLLERSRVVSVRAPERSFHIFYQLCAGADDALRQRLHLQGGAPGFRYLSQSKVYYLDDVDDADAFQQTLDAMRIIGLKQEAVDVALQSVAAILHLGNIEFAPAPGDEATLAGNAAESALEAAAQLLGVAGDDLLGALTTRAIETRGERIVKKLDADAAAESRDALAKTLYSRLFDWLVAAVNRKIGSLGGGGRTARTIGILDIYGFESFDRNSFEQLCINLANEKLQQAFNAHVFKGEQAQYSEEGIEWSYVDFIDNQDVLDLLEGSTGPNGSMGVFPLIDEACRLPRATHQDLAHALRTKLEGKPRFAAPRRDQHAFVVDHYAGEVCYSTEAVLDKNRDFVVAEHLNIMRHSKVTLLRDLFSAEAEAATGAGIGGGDSEPLSPGLSRTTSGAQQRRSSFMLASVGSRFRRQLAGLMGVLGECQPHFIRCIKPNPASQPGSLAPPYVLEQLRAGGVLEAVRIACAGFPTRKPFLPFAQRYAILLGSARVKELGVPFTTDGFIDWDATSEAQLVEVVKRVLYGAGIDGWQLGRTRVFLRSGLLAQLEGARGRVLAAAVVKIQAAWRGLDARRKLATARAAAIRIQAAWRSYVAKKEAEAKRQELAATKVQAAWRGYAARSAFVHRRRSARAVVIQSHWRRYQARSRFLHETEMGRRAAAKAEEEAKQAAAALRLQSAWRRVRAERQAKALAAQAARFKALEAEVTAGKEERARLLAALHEAEARAEKAETELAAVSARAATLKSELHEMHAELEAAKAAAVAAACAGEAGAAAAQQAAAARAAELEEAHRSATQALKEEAAVAQQQKLAAEAATATVQARLQEMETALATEKSETAAARDAVSQRDAEVASLKEALATAKRENVALQAAAEAAAAAAAAEATAALRAAEERASQAAASNAAALSTEMEELRLKLVYAEDESSRQAALLREAQEKGSRLAARVEALSSRAERLESDARAAAAREHALLQELEGAKRAAATARSPGPSHLGQSIASTPIRRTITQELDAAASAIDAASPVRRAVAGEGAVEGDGKDLSAACAASVATLTQAVVFKQLPYITAWSGPNGSIKVPQVAGLLFRCLEHWALEWRQPDLAAAVRHLEASIAATAAEKGLGIAAYWFSASLATGALMKTQSIGKAGLTSLFQLADLLIGFTDLHVAMGAAIREEVPVNVALLLSDEAKRCARRRAVARPVLASVGANGLPLSPRTAQQLGACSPASPADTELANMGSAERHWRGVLGGIANVVETLRAAGVPAPAVRAVTFATLRYIDGELLNALLLRRDCCSVSAAKALHTGLAALRELPAFVGAEWSCSREEAALALERSLQASRFLVQGKDDCVRKALKGMDVSRDLLRLCPALSLRQVHRLAELQHDDWLAGAGSAAGSQTLVLLDMLRRLMNERGGRMSGASGTTRPESAGTPPAPGGTAGTAGGTPGWVTFGQPDADPADLDLEDEEGLLVDSLHAFEMFRSVNTLTRRLLTDAAKFFVTIPKDGPSGAALHGPPSTPSAALRSPSGPLLPNGSLPQLSPSKTPGSPGGGGLMASPVRMVGEPPASPLPAVSLSSAIDRQSVAAGLPEELQQDPAFAFLSA